MPHKRGEAEPCGLKLVPAGNDDRSEAIAGRSCHGCFASDVECFRSPEIKAIEPLMNTDETQIGKVPWNHCGMWRHHIAYGWTCRIPSVSIHAHPRLNLFSTGLTADLHFPGPSGDPPSARRKDHPRKPDAPDRTRLARRVRDIHRRKHLAPQSPSFLVARLVRDLVVRVVGVEPRPPVALVVSHHRRAIQARDRHMDFFVLAIDLSARWAVINGPT